MRRSSKKSFLTAGFLSLVLVAAMAMPALASHHQVTVCNRTGSETNPYAQTSPPKAQIWEGHGQGGEGGLHPDNIIPPFAAGSQGGQSWGDFPGLNWTAEGQAIWNNGCKAVSDGGGGGEEQQEVLDVAVRVSDAEICLGDQVTVTLDNTGSNVEASFSGQLVWPGGPSPLAVGPYVVAAGASSSAGAPLTDTPSVTGTYTIDWTATGGDGLEAFGSASFTVLDDCGEQQPGDPEPQEELVQPGVAFVDPTCAAPSGSWTGTPIEGVAYALTTGTVGPGNAVTVTATAGEGLAFLDAAEDLVYELAFDHTFAALTDCGSNETPDPIIDSIPDPIVEPIVVTTSALGSQICPDGSTNQVDYLIGGANWDTGTLTVGDLVIVVSPGSFGSLPWPVDDDGLQLASVVGTLQVDGQLPVEFGPLTPDAACTEVLGEAEGDEPATVPVVQPVRQDSEVLGESESLARTGASALVLTLLGLFGIASGGAIIRRRDER